MKSTKVEDYVRTIPDFPEPGIMFRDVTSVLQDADGLKNNETVSVTYDSASMGKSEGSIYLHKAYIRTENKQSYVYIRGKDKRLKKQYVTIGQMQYEYIEVVSGLTEDDYIAFPYGKNVVEGAKTKISENDEEIIW